MIKLNCEIRSMQNWKAPDRVSTLFRKGNKHRQVQNPPKISWGTVLFAKKEASPAELSDQLSLSPSTGSVVCSYRGFRGHGDPSRLHGHLRWGFRCLCPGAVSRGGPCEKRQQGGCLPSSQGEPLPCGQRAVPFHDRQTIVLKAQSTWPTRQLELWIVPFFSWCVFQHRRHKDKPVVWSFHYKDIPSRYRNRLYAPTGPACQSMVSLLREKVERKNFSPLKVPSPSPWNV